MSTRTPAPIGDVAVTSRALADYRQMFLLIDDELLAGPILDCPSGTSPFGAQVRARGGTVVSVDPAYREPPAALVARSLRDIQRATAWVSANPQLVPDVSSAWCVGVRSAGGPS